MTLGNVQGSLPSIHAPSFTLGPGQEDPSAAAPHPSQVSSCPSPPTAHPVHTPAPTLAACPLWAWDPAATLTVLSPLWKPQQSCSLSRFKATRPSPKLSLPNCHQQ